MKAKHPIRKKLTAEEIAESTVFPSRLDRTKKDQSLEGFREFRRKAEVKRKPSDRLMSQLLQLRFLMEDYIKSAEFQKEYHFGYFLKEYIVRLDKKNKEFAEEISIEPSELSQLINRHRQPNEKLLIRLEIHSNKNLPAITWFRVIEKEKAFGIIYNKSLRTEEKKHVKNTLEFSL